MNLFNYQSGKKLSKYQSYILTSYFRIEGFCYKLLYILGVILGIMWLFLPLIVLVMFILLMKYLI